jgi:hypothetical protein
MKEPDMNPEGGPQETRAEGPESEQQFQRLFAAAGKREQPSAAQIERWQQTFAAGLAGHRRGHRVRRAAAVVLACAAVLAIAVGVRLATPVVADPPVVAEVVAAFGGNVARRGEQLRGLQHGSAVLDGERVESGLRSSLALRYRGADVRLAPDTTVTFRLSAFELQRGAVYVDTGVSGLPPGSVQVNTPLGSISHRGTQFMVQVADGSLLAAVREGVIVVEHQAQALELAAPPGKAAVIELRGNAAPARSEASASGDLWSWTQAAGPGMVVAGHTVDEVLRWAARERGQALQYSNDPVARLAASTPLGGANRLLHPNQAIELINVATGLRITGTPPDALIVALASEGDKDPD